MTTPMSKDHKAALAEGRRRGAAVRRYLEALEAHKPKRGRRRTPESINARLAQIADEIDGAPILTRLQLIQNQIDLREELARLEAGPGVDLAAFEAEFVAVAKDYSEAKGITYAAWREIGVAAKTLAAAGITR